MINKELDIIYNMDCIEGMKILPDKSIDMILCDLPYGTTQCKWDVVIPFADLWKQYKRIIKDNGAIVLTSAQPFTSLLITSNLEMFKYALIWEKSKATGFMNAKKRPLVAYEDILVFYKKPVIYNPQMTEGKPYDKGKILRKMEVYGSQKATETNNTTGLRYPRSVVYFKTAESEGKVYHPTQKPMALFEYLIKTYTNPGDLVLDNCMGAGTTAIACKNTNRHYIGYEKEEKYFDIISKRINELFKNKKIK